MVSQGVVIITRVLWRYGPKPVEAYKQFTIYDNTKLCLSCPPMNTGRERFVNNNVDNKKLSYRLESLETGRQPRISL